MRILIFNWQDIRNPLAGGAEVHLHQVFSRIAARGHDVTLYCSGFPGGASEELCDGIKVVREGGRFFFNYRVPLAYASRFRKKGFDIVVDDMNKIPFCTPLFVREPLYGIGHHLFGKSIFVEANPLVAGYVYAMERLALRLYASSGTPFIVNSESTFDDFVSRGIPPERLQVVHLAVNHSVYRPGGVPRSATPLAAHFGRLKRYKSVEVLLKAVPIVQRQVPDLRLVIVGEGDDRQRLEGVARELRIADAVEFTGFVPEHRQVEYMQKAWCAVSTSAKEGWGMTTTEANACGTPVIASNVPGLRDAVRDGETGILTPYGDHEALARAMVKMLQDREFRERLSAESVRYAAGFTWDAAADQTLACLQRRMETFRNTP
jgi:glycosyltransferase involved in cell wall biosynthesis